MGLLVTRSKFSQNEKKIIVWQVLKHDMNAEIGTIIVIDVLCNSLKPEHACLNWIKFSCQSFFKELNFIQKTLFICSLPRPITSVQFNQTQVTTLFHFVWNSIVPFQQLFIFIVHHYIVVICGLINVYHSKAHTRVEDKKQTCIII